MQIKTILLWFLTGFMFLSAIFFVPSTASVIMLLFAAIAAPHKQVEAFWASKGLTGLLKTALLCVLFALAVVLAPT